MHLAFTDFVSFSVFQKSAYIKRRRGKKKKSKIVNSLRKIFPKNMNRMKISLMNVILSI